MIWKGREYRPGQIISEWLYEEFIDVAYGRGVNLRETKLWKDSYRYGFACPDEDGGWIAFAYDGKKYRFLGTFDDSIFPEEEEDWYDYRERMLSEADRSSSEKAIDILRKLYVSAENWREQTAAGLLIAKDPECIQYMVDYWSYVRWCEHGNECSLSEVMFEGFVNDILDPQYVLEYLSNDEDTEEARRLEKVLKNLHRRYGGKR